MYDMWQLMMTLTVTQPSFSCWQFYVLLGQYWIHFVAYRPRIQTNVILGVFSLPLGSARIMYEIRS